MGMYDIGISKEINQLCPLCPICKSKFIDDLEWQTKSYENLLYTYSLSEIKNGTNSNFEFHTLCPECNSYIKLNFQEDRVVLNYSNTDIKVTRRLPDEAFDLYQEISK